MENGYVSFCDLDKLGNGEKCSAWCTKIYLPICGSDGETYANKCEFKYANCQHNPNLKIKHNGECKSNGKILKGIVSPLERFSLL